MIEREKATGLKPTGRFNWSVIVIIGLGDLILWALGIGSTYWFFGQHVGVGGLAFTTVAPALWTFLLFYRDAADVRTALTAAFFVLYLGFIITAFNSNLSKNFAENGSFLHSVWDNVNTLMIAIVGFYFGGKAFEAAAERTSRKSRTANEDSGPRDPTVEIPPTPD
jgi:hypothetical protein